MTREVGVLATGILLKPTRIVRFCDPKFYSEKKQQWGLENVEFLHFGGIQRLVHLRRSIIVTSCHILVTC